MIAETVIRSWMKYQAEYGIADVLRCAASEIQDDHDKTFGEITPAQFAEGAIACGYNAATARRCWAYVKAQ